MSSKSIFTQEHAARSTRIIQGFDSVYSNLAIGHIEGVARVLPALMADTATDDSIWRVVNLVSKDEDNKNVYDAVAVLGAVDNQEAEAWALLQHGRFIGDSTQVGEIIETNKFGLMRYLADPSLHSYQSPVRSRPLEALQDVATGERAVWDGMELKSHGGLIANLLHDLIKHDDHYQLFDAMKAGDLAGWLQELGAEKEEYDALIVQKSKLDLLVTKLSSAMGRATDAGVSIASVTQSEPFKKNKVTQIAVIFELSDGQSVSILFHNPDSQPNKLLATDTLISWKWLLNGRDVSAVIQPNQGQDVLIPQLAVRIMKLVNKNSARFTRTIAKKDENLQALAETRTRIEQKTQTAADLDAEMVTLQAELDKPVVATTEQKNQQAFDGVAQVLVSDYGWAQKGDALEKSFTGVQAAGELNPDGSAVVTIRRKDVIIAATMGNGMDEPKIIGTEFLPQNNQNEADYRKTAYALNEKVGLYLLSQMPNPDLEVTQPVSGEKPKIVTKTEAKEVYDALSWVHGWLTGGTGAEFLRQNYPDGVKEELDAAKAMLERPFNKVAEAQGWKDRLQSMIATVEKTIDRWNAGQKKTTSVDPTSPEFYGKIVNSKFLQEEYQDQLDSFFQGRMIAVRNAMRELGWDGERFKDLSKNGKTAKFEFQKVGAGANIVGYSVDGFLDDLTMTPEEFAAFINGKNTVVESPDREFNYMLLSRLKADNDYFLGNGNRGERALWAGNVKDQIAKMKKLWNALTVKPDWLSMEQIEQYEKDMTEPEVDSKLTAKEFGKKGGIMESISSDFWRIQLMRDAEFAETNIPALLSDKVQQLKDLLDGDKLADDAQRWVQNVYDLGRGHIDRWLALQVGSEPEVVAPMTPDSFIEGLTAGTRIRVIIPSDIDQSRSVYEGDFVDEERSPSDTSGYTIRVMLNSDSMDGKAVTFDTNKVMVELVDMNPDQHDKETDGLYLTAIIEGRVDFTDGDAIEAELTTISERLTDETTPLFEQAADAYANWAISQAATV